MYIQSILFSTIRGRNHDRPVIGGDKSDVADKAFIENGIDSLVVVFSPLGQTSNLGVLCGWKRTHAPRVEPQASRVNHSAKTTFFTVPHCGTFCDNRSCTPLTCTKPDKT